ncbi:MAG: ankyrin repeat domain-containing protein [Rudaea sp.]
MRSALAAGSTFLLLQVIYVSCVGAALAMPVGAVMRDHALPSALLLSTVIFIALLALWRVWPAFALPFSDASAQASPPFASAAECLVFAGRITMGRDLYFASGFVVSVCMLLMAVGALGIAGLGPQLPAGWQLPAVAVYALALSPAGLLVILRRTQLALLRRPTPTPEPVREVETAPERPATPSIPRSVIDFGRSLGELNAALLRGASTSDIDAAIAMLERGADPDCAPEPGARDQRSVLVLASLSPNLALLRALIAKGVDVNRAHAGLPALIAATRDSHQGRPDAVMTLLTNGADPRCVDAEGNTPLHYAARAAQPVVAALLCDAGAPIDATNHEGLTPLAIASAAGKCDSVRFLLERRANPQVERSQPALVAAAGMADEDPDLIKLLLKHKAQVNARDTMGRSALISAALHDNPDIAGVLLKAGADVNATDDRGTTALMEAARAGAVEVIDVLAAHSPAIDAVDRLGRTALMLASQSAQADEAIVRRLLALGASSAITTTEGRRAVDLAAAAGRWTIVKLLDPEYPLPASVEGRADAPVQRGVTPAHLLDALRFAHWSIVDAFAPDVREWTGEQRAQLFHELAEHPDPQSRAWLLRHSLDPNARLADGKGLLATLLARLPETLSAAEQLLAAGAQVAGAGMLAPVFDAMRGASEAQRDRLETIALEMLARGADPFGADALARTPLACSIANGQALAAEWLLERGVDANLRDRHGRSALFAALGQPPAIAERLVRALIRAGADPELADANGETPLGIALAQPQSAIRRWLNWTQWKLPKRPLRDSDLPAAAKQGDAAAVDNLLDLGLAIDATDAQGATALVHAAGAGHVEIASGLLDRGAQTERAAAAGATALSAAVSARRAAVVAAMLERKIDPDQRLAGGGTALMIAAALGYPEIVAQLLAHAADPNAQDERATRALHAAAQFAFASRDTPRARKVLELLMEKGADLNAIDGKGRTPLLFLLGARAEPGSAGDQQHLQALLSLFLVGRADVNCQDERGVSALHACAMHGLLIPARALLVARADPEARDMRGRTPREVANLLGYLDVAAELIMRPLASTALPGQPAEFR